STALTGLKLLGSEWSEPESRPPRCPASPELIKISSPDCRTCGAGAEAAHAARDISRSNPRNPIASRYSMSTTRGLPINSDERLGTMLGPPDRYPDVPNPAREIYSGRAKWMRPPTVD